MKKSTMMISTDPEERNAALAARVHRLTDPLAAMNQRSHYERVQRETRARMVLLAVTLTALLAFTGAIATVSDPGETREPGIAYEAGQSQPVHIRSRSS